MLTMEKEDCCNSDIYDEVLIFSSRIKNLKEMASGFLKKFKLL